VLLENTAYRKESFPSKDTDTKLLQNICFAYEIDIISSYSDSFQIESVTDKFLKTAQRMLGTYMRL